MWLCLSAVACGIRWWTISDQQEFRAAASVGPPEFAHCIGSVDATYIQVQRPKDYAWERRLYSTYKKYHAVFFVAVVDRKGQQ
jgi:hypothetical protein